MTVTLEKSDHVATITLRRPEVRNALDRPTTLALAARFREAAEDADVRVVLLAGEGAAFCSGADLRSVDPAGLADPKARVEEFHDLVRAIVQAPQPVLAFVDGPAVGFGANLALASDLVIATERAYFLMAFTRLGIVSDGGGTWLLPRRIGTARTMEMLLLAERVPAATALAWGLVSRVVPPERGPQEARALALRLARGPARAYAKAKRLVREGGTRTFLEALDAERDAQVEALAGPEPAEGILAFLEKREPDFRKVPR